MSMLEKKIEEARKAHDQEAYQEASKLYMDALTFAENNHDRAVVWVEISINFYRMHAWQSTIEAAENALRFDPGYKAREDLYRISGFAWQAMGDMEKARIFLEKSIQIDTHSEKQHIAIYELGKIYFVNQAYEQAGRLFNLIEQALEENNRDYWLSLLFFKGFIAYYLNETDQSKSYFESLLKNTEDNKRKASALFGMAFIAFAEKDYLKTINICESVLSHDPEFFDRETLGFLTAASFHNLGRADIFEQYYEQLMMNYPEGRYADELRQLKEKDTPKD